MPTKVVWGLFCVGQLWGLHWSALYTWEHTAEGPVSPLGEGGALCPLPPLTRAPSGWDLLRFCVYGESFFFFDSFTDI